MQQIGKEIFPYLKEGMELEIFCDGKKFGTGRVTDVKNGVDEDEMLEQIFFVDSEELGPRSEFRFIDQLNPRDNGWIHFFDHPLAGSAMVPLGAKVTSLNEGIPPTFTFVPKI